MLLNAHPFVFRVSASCPYVIPADTLTDASSGSTSMSTGMSSWEISVPLESARSLKEWREPSARTYAVFETIPQSSSTLRGLASCCAEYV